MLVLLLFITVIAFELINFVKPSSRNTKLKKTNKILLLTVFVV